MSTKEAGRGQAASGSRPDDEVRSFYRNYHDNIQDKRLDSPYPLPWCINTGKSLIPLTLLFLAQKRNLLIPLELSGVMHQGRSEPLTGPCSVGKEAARRVQNQGQGYLGVAD